MFTTIKILVLAVMMYAAYQDIKHKEISALGIILCAVLSVISAGIRIYFGESLVMPAIALLPGAAFVLISLATRGEIGIGDGFLLMGIGPAFGLEHTILGVFVALGVTSLLSIVMLILKKGNGKSQLPFVPFMTVGMGVMMFA